MRPRAISLVVTLGIFLGGLTLVWALSGQSRGRAAVLTRDQVFTFPLNSSRQRVSVRSHWRRGHMTPQDDAVELTLEGTCATAHLYAYLSTGWDEAPVSTAAVILGTSLHPAQGPPPRVVRSTSQSAIVLSLTTQRGVLVERAAPRDYNALVVEWQAKQGCNSSAQTSARRELGRLFETFRVIGEHAAATAVKAA